MKYLARTATGDPLLGDEDGYVPLGAVEPDLETVGDALPPHESKRISHPF